jgi:hypothetical protein
MVVKADIFFEFCGVAAHVETFHPLLILRTLDRT